LAAPAYSAPACGLPEVGREDRIDALIDNRTSTSPRDAVPKGVGHEEIKRERVASAPGRMRARIVLVVGVQLAGQQRHRRRCA
jgi:hypothetical protein